MVDAEEEEAGKDGAKKTEKPTASRPRKATSRPKK
jgi:hypothetical protein